jgi:hypothetical protein
LPRQQVSPGAPQLVAQRRRVLQTRAPSHDVSAQQKPPSLPHSLQISLTQTRSLLSQAPPMQHDWLSSPQHDPSTTHGRRQVDSWHSSPLPQALSAQQS